MVEFSYMIGSVISHTDMFRNVSGSKREKFIAEICRLLSMTKYKINTLSGKEMDIRQYYLFRNWNHIVNKTSQEENDPEPRRQYEKCRNCNYEADLLELSNMDEVVCASCGMASDSIDLEEHYNSSEREYTLEKTKFIYDRRFHFNAVLNGLQCRFIHQIPSNVMDTVLEELDKGNIPPQYLNREIVYNILKRQKLSDFNHMISSIMARINPDLMISIPETLVMKMQQMFATIQTPFMLYCPEDGNNMLNYQFILKKFCGILELENLGIDYDPHFTESKSRKRQIQYESLWTKICTHLNNQRAMNLSWK